MTNELEAWVVMQVINIAFRSGKQVVYTNDLITAGEKSVDQMRAKETCATSHQYSFSVFIVAHDFISGYFCFSRLKRIVFSINETRESQLFLAA